MRIAYQASIVGVSIRDWQSLCDASVTNVNGSIVRLPGRFVPYQRSRIIFWLLHRGMTVGIAHQQDQARVMRKVLLDTLLKDGVPTKYAKWKYGHGVCFSHAVHVRKSVLWVGLLL